MQPNYMINKLGMTIAAMGHGGRGEGGAVIPRRHCIGGRRRESRCASERGRARPGSAALAQHPKSTGLALNPGQI
jgi:hypothetical protein